MHDSPVPLSLFRLIFVRCVSTVGRNSTYPVLHSLAALVPIARRIKAFIANVGSPRKSEQCGKPFIIVCLPHFVGIRGSVDGLKNSFASTCGVPWSDAVSVHYGQLFERSAMLEELHSDKVFIFVKIMITQHLSKDTATS